VKENRVGEGKGAYKIGGKGLVYFFLSLEVGLI